MPPVNPHDEPIDIVSRPVNPDGTVEEPERGPAPASDSMDMAFRRRAAETGSSRAEVRYWRFEGAGDDGCGCGCGGCMTAILLLLLLLLLRSCS